MGVLEDRAGFEKEIEGDTIAHALSETAERHPDAPAFTQGEETLTWGETRREVLRVASAFAALGLEPGDVVALMMPNRSEHVLADLGAVHAGGIPTTLYATLAPEQIAHVAGDCAARYAVLNGRDELDRWLPVLSGLPGLREIIMLNDCPSGDERFLPWEDFLSLGDGTCSRWRELSPDDTLTVLYTSGTTGAPKGVLITHRMALYEGAVSNATSDLPEHGVGVSYLPFAHIADRVLSIYLPILRASHIHFCADPAALAGVLATARPHGFFGVPRVWEKMMGAIQAVLDADGWVHTGDIGAIDADGFLTVVDRRKEIIITAGGENIAPSMIENLLKEHPLVGQALVYGDRRPYVVAVITLDGEVAPVWAAAHGVDGDLTGHPAVLEEVAAAVDAANARLARVQQIKRWRLLPGEWTAESAELTPTLKLKRRVIHARYAEEIAALYA